MIIKHYIPHNKVERATGQPVQLRHSKFTAPRFPSVGVAKSDLSPSLDKRGSGHDKMKMGWSYVVTLGYVTWPR